MINILTFDIIFVVIMKILAFDVIMVVNMTKEKNFKAFKKLKGKLIGNSFLTQVKHC